MIGTFHAASLHAGCSRTRGRTLASHQSAVTHAEPNVDLHLADRVTDGSSSKRRRCNGVVERNGPCTVCTAAGSNTGVAWSTSCPVFPVPGPLPLPPALPLPSELPWEPSSSMKVMAPPVRPASVPPPPPPPPPPARPPPRAPTPTDRPRWPKPCTGGESDLQAPPIVVAMLCDLRAPPKVPMPKHR